MRHVVRDRGGFRRVNREGAYPSWIVDPLKKKKKEEKEEEKEKKEEEEEEK